MSWTICCVFVSLGFVISAEPIRAANEKLEVDTYINRALALAEKHDYDKAKRTFDAAVHRYPRNPETHYSRGAFYLERGDYKAAWNDLNATVLLAPTALMASIARGVAYARMGKYDLALEDYNRVVNLHPSGSCRAAVLNNKAWLQATCPESKFRNGRQALADAKQAVGYGRWRKASCLGTLAAAYAEVGDFDSAIKYQQRAIAAETKLDPLRDAEKQLSCYRHHQPFREAGSMPAPVL